MIASESRKKKCKVRQNSSAQSEQEKEPSFLLHSYGENERKESGKKA